MFFISYDTCECCFCLFKAKQTRFYLAFQRCTFKKTMATDLVMANKYSWQNWDQRKSPDNREIRIIEVWIIKVRLYLFWADNLFALFFNFLLPIPHFLPHPLRPPRPPKTRQTNKQTTTTTTHIHIQNKAKQRDNGNIRPIVGKKKYENNLKNNSNN